MTELAWYLVPLGAVLWAMGGSGFPPFKKGWRRYVYPLSLLTLWLVTGWPILLVAVLTSVAAHLGYGDTHSWEDRVIVGAIYGSAVIPLGAVPVGLIGAILWLAWFLGWLWLTRRFNQVPHKLAELMIGGGHALVVVWLVSR